METTGKQLTLLGMSGWKDAKNEEDANAAIHQRGKSRCYLDTRHK
jgi:hypothetical protein